MQTNANRYSIRKSFNKDACDSEGRKHNKELCNPEIHSVFWQCALAVIIYAILSMPIIRNTLEQYLLLHMLIQIPLLAVCGVVLGNQWYKVNDITIAYYHALPLLLIALTFIMFWMLPRNLDASLIDTRMTIFKYVSIPVLIGLPLSLGWKSVGVITRAFFLVNIVSMLALLSWLYQSAPSRLCSYYLINEQQYLGQAMLYIIMVISVFYLFRLFVKQE